MSETTGEQKKPASTEEKQKLMQDFLDFDKSLKQLKKQTERILEIGVHKLVFPDGYFEEVKKLTEKLCELYVYAVMIKIQPMRIQLVLKNCPELFAKNEFRVESASIELVGFNWYLAAEVKEKGFLAVHLHAVPLSWFKGNYQIEVDWRLSIVNTLVDKNLIENDIGYVYTVNEKNQTGRGFPNMAKFQDLLDPAQTFLTPEGDLEIWADITIKSATLNQ